MTDWICPKCGHEVIADKKPQPIRWTDGHICYFVETDLDDLIRDYPDRGNAKKCQN